jgi:hypothetical protein
VPVHDWTRVDAGLFHNFHRGWISALCDALNLGGLASDFFALAEPSMPGAVPDVLTLPLAPGKGPPSQEGGVAVAEAPPRARVVRRSEVVVYAHKADRITVRHRSGKVVAVVEIVSPGNKGGTSAARTFVEKGADLIQQGVHLLVVDLFPPTRRDPQGLVKAIWDEIEVQDFTLPPDKPLTVAAIEAALIQTAYIEPIAVGDVLPDMPLFLAPEFYVPAPLGATYKTTWEVFPNALKGLLEP